MFPNLTLPKDWTARIKSALLCSVAFARIALVEARARVSQNDEIAGIAELDWFSNEIALLREELRIKDARLSRIPPARRPHYPPTERLAILALKAARGWNAAQAAHALFLSEVTIANWLRRIDEPGPGGFLALRAPVNRFPDFVKQVVQHLKTVCPTMGKVRIAQLLARAGLRLSPSTVRRFLRESVRPIRGPSAAVRKTNNKSDVLSAAIDKADCARAVVAKRSHQVWHIDLTIVPTHLGFWVPWFPFSWAQSWPFAYCVAVVVDHFSRKAIAIEVFKKWPKSDDITRWLDVIIGSSRHCPKYIISDNGVQFRTEYQDWCAARGVKPRFGAVGQHGSIAIVERFILSLKNECTRRIMVLLQLDRFREELLAYLRWYNEVRPHQSHGGRTPNEVAGDTATVVLPRMEPRARIFELAKHHRQCDPSVVAVNDLHLRVERFEGRAHLPIVHLELAA